MSSFATEIAMSIFQKIEKMTDEQIERLIKKVESYSQANCWYMEYGLKGAILTACRDVLEARKESEMIAGNLQLED